MDDGSRDATAGVAEEYSQPPSPVRLLRNPGNKGKGYAVRHGMLDAEGDWILYTDADLSAPIEELKKLYSSAAAQNAVIAIGSRAVDRSLVAVHQSAFREYSGRFFNLVMRTADGPALPRYPVRIQALSRRCGQRGVYPSGARRLQFRR